MRKCLPRLQWTHKSLTHACHQVTLGGSGPPATATKATAAVNHAEGQHCNWYLPDSSSLDRYMWSVQWFVANGFYVLMDYQPAADDPTSKNGQVFVDAWQWLWRSVACLPNFESDLQGRVFVDLMGTPDAAGHRWEPVTGVDGTIPGAYYAAEVCMHRYVLSPWLAGRTGHCMHHNAWYVWNCGQLGKRLFWCYKMPSNSNSLHAQQTRHVRSDLFMRQASRNFTWEQWMRCGQTRQQQ